MKILLVCMLHTYGDESREYSFEYFNFYQVLKQMGHEVELFDYMKEIKVHGKAAMNQKLLKRAKHLKPSVSIFSLYTDQFEPETINVIRDHTKTFCFFHDDTWRIEYSKYWAAQFDYFSTPDVYGVRKYKELGFSNAIYFPFGCNEILFQNKKSSKKYDVSFVGGWHPYREWLINRISKAGISVIAMGHRWPRGEINQNEMVNVFNESKINLNISNSASWDLRYLTSSPRALLNRIRSKKNIEQMKARIFEVSSCGGFQLTYYVEGLANCYEIDREIPVYADADDLIEKIKFYLKYESLRDSIASAAYARTQKEHTYSQRFKAVFLRMGLENE
jgi:spore maturation protein CgeB